ncbi:MAG: ribokinase [Pseudomonadota bacterium]
MIFNLGSINADYFYDLPHLPRPGETLAATRMSSGLGGKGANQSVAAALAGGDVRHIGCVGPDGSWAVDRLRDFGVDVQHVRVSDTPTAHAIVMVDEAGENQIVIYPGANQEQDERSIAEALEGAGSDDWLMLQNETSHQGDAARLAREKGLNVAYSAAPFDVQAIESVLPFVTLVITNEVEAQQYADETGRVIKDLPVSYVLITKGKDGATWHDLDAGKVLEVSAFKVDPVDTTGAGDTFAGYATAGLAQGLPVDIALKQASAAAALSTTKKGTADAIPTLAAVKALLGS